MPRARHVDMGAPAVEAKIHFSLFAHLQNLQELATSERLFDRVEAEVRLATGRRADIVLYKEDRAFLVIECKRQQGTKIIRSIDPLAADVISQAVGYAVELGAPYFATYNGAIGSLFQTHQEGIPLFERNCKIFRNIEQNHKYFANELLASVEAAAEGSESWADFDERFIGRMASLHSLLLPKIRETLLRHLEDASPYIQKVRAWFASFGVLWDEKKTSDITDRLLPLFSKQAAYVLIDKLLFYRVLEAKYPSLPKLHPCQNPAKILASVKRCFGRGRDGPHGPPPAQIRACASNALGSCLEFWRQIDCQAMGAEYVREVTIYPEAFASGAKL